MRAEPVPADSILHRYADDWRGLLIGGGTGILQLMHPAIGAGVVQHSKFFDEPFERIRRSLAPIRTAKLGGPAAAAAASKIREFHRDIKGVDDRGRRYHALDPEVFFWAHATFIHADLTWIDLYHHKLDPAERAQIYDAGKQWYRLYGVSDRPMPADIAAFDAYWEHMCVDVLEPTEAALWSVRAFDDPGRFPIPGLPRPAWSVLGRPFLAEQKLLTAAMLHPAVREKLGLRFTALDAMRFRVRVAALKRLHPIVNPLALRGINWLAQAA